LQIAFRYNHRGADYDVLFECWAAADRLRLHAVAAECQWALTMLWDREIVYMRAPMELSLRALQRITRSLCAGMDDESGEVRYKGEEFFMCKYRIARAPTMMEWRMSDEAQAASTAAAE